MKTHGWQIQKLLSSFGIRILRRLRGQAMNLILSEQVLPSKTALRYKAIQINNTSGKNARPASVIDIYPYLRLVKFFFLGGD